MVQGQQQRHHLQQQVWTGSILATVLLAASAGMSTCAPTQLSIAEAALVLQSRGCSADQPEHSRARRICPLQAG